MFWKGRRESGNVEDRRGMGAGTLGGGGLLIGAVIVYLLGGNPLTFLAENSGQLQNQQSPASSAKDDDRKSFVSVVLADTEDVWTAQFSEANKTYEPPRLILFRGTVQSACGRASSAVGPFYCPGDRQVYFDLGFLDELSQKLGAKGDFAGAYVVAHEVGHHIQNLLGLAKGTGNAASVQIELQADCLAGVWAKQTEQNKDVIEKGDIDEALGTAAAIGDDRLQQRSQGEVVPDSFTHGSSAQRVAAFKRGYSGGALQSCMRD